MEQTLPKEKILELYLNVIEWGPNVWGLREAAGHYFAKRPDELTLLEAAYLVTIIPNPRMYHKHVEGGAVPPSFERRVKWLIEEMERRKRIGGDDVAAALEQHIRFAAVQPPSGGDATPGDEPPDEEFGGD
jgi:membrane peptidoglycan carboxypeptidase